MHEGPRVGFEPTNQSLKFAVALSAAARGAAAPGDSFRTLVDPTMENSFVVFVVRPPPARATASSPARATASPPARATASPPRPLCRLCARPSARALFRVGGRLRARPFDRSPVGPPARRPVQRLLSDRPPVPRKRNKA